MQAGIIYLDDDSSFEEAAQEASIVLSQRITSVDSEFLYDKFLEGTGIGATPVSHGAALPHVRMSGIDHPYLVIVRAVKGITINITGPLENTSHEPVYALFFLVSPADDAAQHLRVLAQLATHIDNDKFMERWLAVDNDQDLKELLLRDERYISLQLKPQKTTVMYIGLHLREIRLPQDALLPWSGDREKSLSLTATRA